MFFANGAQYQEAPSNITNEKGDHVGTGTGESVGYAFTNDVILNNQLRLAGLSGMPADFIPPKPDAALIAQSKDYLDPNKHPDHFATLFDEALHCGDVPGQNDTNPIPVVGRFN